MTPATIAPEYSGPAGSNRSMSHNLSGKMKSRTEMLAADLYVLLQREFRRRQRPECKECYMQVPFQVDRRGTDSPNWEVVMPPPCPYACQHLVDELVSEFGMLYDLEVEERVDRA
jgi:hypothetical protein